MTETTAVGIERDGNIAIVELQRPPHNYVDATIMGQVADAVEELAKDNDIHAVVLASAGKSFCAGVNFTAPGEMIGSIDGTADGAGSFAIGARGFYDEALRVYGAPLPLIAALQGAAIGGGAGLALACDLRVSCPEAAISTNFVKLGIHQGFGLSVTLPELVGPSRAADMLLTGRRVKGEEGLAIGLVDRCVPRDEVRASACELAHEIAANAPLATAAVRATLREGLVDRVRTALAHELEEQARLATTADAAEGIAAVFGKRDPNFTGR